MAPRWVFWPSLTALAVSPLAPVAAVAGVVGLLAWVTFQVRASRSGALDRNDW